MPGGSRSLLFLILGSVSLALAVRLPGLFSGLWLDEVWSIDAVRGLDSISDIFVRLRIDNNHHLNSVYLFLLQDRTFDAIYRIPSLIAGVVAAGFAVAVADKSDRAFARVTALAFASSYLLVHYGTEASGYALVVLCALGSHYCLI